MSVLFELDREARLHRDVVAQLESLDRADSMRSALLELGHAARVASLDRSAESQRRLERAADDVERLLGDGSGREMMGEPGREAARIAVLNARSIAPITRARGREAGNDAAREAESMASRVADSLGRTFDAQASEIARRTARQIRTGETLRTTVGLALAGSIALLGIVYALYRAARRRERAALARIAHLAHYDAITTLPNRRLLDDRLELEVVRARREKSEFAVVLFDLDGFKEVNDTWGHDAGDKALRIVGERAKAAMRASDTVGRLGGDEFMALWPATSHDGAARVAEKLRAALCVDYVLGAAIAQMSASIGIALYPADGDDGDALRHAADAALYAAKRAGKNRVCFASAAKAAATVAAG